MEWLTPLACIPGKDEEACIPGIDVVVCILGNDAAGCMPGNDVAACIPGNDTEGCIPAKDAAACIPGKDAPACIPGREVGAVLGTDVCGPGKPLGIPASAAIPRLCPVAAAPCVVVCIPGNPPGTGGLADRACIREYAACMLVGIPGKELGGCLDCKVIPGKDAEGRPWGALTA